MVSSIYTTRFLRFPRVVISLFGVFRTSELRDTASNPCGRDAALPKRCSAKPLNPYRFRPKILHRFLAVQIPVRPYPAIVTGSALVFPEIPCWKGFLQVFPM